MTLRSRLSTAEVMTIPLVAATLFGGNIDKTCRFLHEYGYMKKMISKSPLDRRLHAIEPVLWRCCLRCWPNSSKRSGAIPTRDLRGGLLTGSVRQHPPHSSLPDLPFGRGGRNARRRGTPKKKSFRGYIVASKRRYFYGLGVHLVVSGAGEPVEFSLAAGSEADVAIFKGLELDLPEGSIILADKAYIPTTTMKTSSKKRACT